MVNKYESMVIIDPVLSNDETLKENEKITNWITENGGEIIKTDNWGKRQLAYEINKKKEGFYFINYFTMDAKKAIEMERFYRLNEKVLRFNLLSDKD